jgi:DNA-binding MarR family transcriptional regulator
MDEAPRTADHAIAEGVLAVARQLLRRVRADLPLAGEPEGTRPSLPAGDGDGWRDVWRLRATPGQMALLRVLADHERCTMQVLAEHLGVAPSTATALVRRLAAQGYVARAHDEADWRVVWVWPTEAGRAAVALYDGAQVAALQRRLTRLSASERADLAVALPALRRLIAEETWR